MKRKNDPGYLLPEVIEPQENCCICIPVPNDFNHKMAFLGQLDELGYWWNWERDTEKKGREAAAVWRKIVACIREEINMSGCGCGGSSEGSYPVQERWNSDNQLEASYDGGATWVLAPERDSRNAVIVFPPRQAGSGDGKCLSSENATAFFKQMLETIVNQISLGGGAAGAAPAVIALLITIGFPTGLGAVLALVYGLISAVIGLVNASLEGTFDTAFYDALKCAFFCVVDEDGTLTKSDLDSVYSDMSAYLGTNPPAQWVLQEIINAVGAKGFTNAARGDSIPTSDCSDCDACYDCSNLDNWTLVYGEEVEKTAGFWRINSTLQPSGFHAVRVWSRDGSPINTCCKIFWDYGFGATNSNSYYTCETPDTPIGGSPPQGGCFVDAHWVHIGGLPFQIEISFAECD